MILDPPPLDEMDRALLGALEENCGTATKDVGLAVYHKIGRRVSADVVRRARYLERHGLVTRLDDNRPIAWVRTPKGTAALAGGKAP